MRIELNQVLALKVPNKLFADGIRDRFQTKLLSLLERGVGHHLDIVYKIADAARTVVPTVEPAVSPSAPANLPISTLNPRYTFSSFVVGASNRYAHATAEAISKAPGTQYNPYFIYGGVGLGKTHLMHAIGNAIGQGRPRARVIYITAEQFVNEYINSIRQNNPDDFRAKYRNLDCLLMDDVQGFWRRS